MLAHADLPTPFEALLREEFLHDMDPALRGEFVPVRVIGVSSYRESVPTFTVLSLAEGGTFHAIPPHALVFSREAAPLPIEDLCYHDCPDETVAAFEIAHYQALETCRVWLPNEEGSRAPVGASYLFTLDWYDDNLLVHGLRLDTGHLCLYPPHKVLFPVPAPTASTASLPDWKKLRTEWSVDGRRPRGRRVFVLGPSGSCKTPFARLLGEALGVAHLSASDGVAQILAPIAHLKETPEQKQQFVHEASARSVAALRAEPDLVIAHLEARIGSEPVVVEGLRNPRDFAWLFDWRTDVVVFLERRDNPYVPGSFEAGLDAIDAQLTWETTIGLLDPERCVRYAHQVDDLEACVADLATRLLGGAA